MLVDKVKYQNQPGGYSKHHYPFLELTLTWSTDIEFRYGPRLWEWLLMIMTALVVAFAVVFI